MALSQRQQQLLEQLQEATVSNSNYFKNAIEKTQWGSTNRRVVDAFIRQYRNALQNYSEEQCDIEKGSHFAERIKKYSLQCDNLLTIADGALKLLNEMLLQHELVRSKTSSLHDSCEMLLSEQEELEARYRQLEVPLRYFLDLEVLAPKIGCSIKFIENNVEVVKGIQRGDVDPISSEYAVVLSRIDECIQYHTDHQDEYLEAKLYLGGFRELLSNAMRSIKDTVIAALETTGEKLNTNHLTTQNQGGLAGIDESSPYYVRFRALASTTRAVPEQIEQRAQYDTYASLVMECHQYYYQLRIQLLTPLVSADVILMCNDQDILSMLRLGCAYMARLCQKEYQLFQALLGVRRTNSSVESFLVDPDEIGFDLCGILYNNIRRQLVHQYDLDVLCEIVHVLRTEIVDEQIHPRGDEAVAFEAVIARLIQDSQERLIFCSQKYIRDEIKGFVPTPQDLDYPKKLEALNSNPETNLQSLYASWYPTVERTLLCLSKIYRYVEMSIFEELAHEAVSECTSSLKVASESIFLASGVNDGVLFLIKNLLTLREQISPFDIQFSITEKSLDFSSTTGALSQFVSDRSALFSLSYDNSLLGLLQHGIPTIHETKLDTKKDLEQELKLICTTFIDHASKVLASPLYTFLQKADIIMEGSVTGHLRQEKNATLDEVQSVLQQVQEAIDANLPILQKKMNLYLANGGTEGILFSPVERTLSEAFGRLQDIIDREYNDEERSVLSQKLSAVQEYFSRVQSSGLRL